MGIEPINGRSENHGKTNNELSDFASRIQEYPDLAKVLKGDLTMRNSYIGAYGGGQHAKAMDLLRSVFADLGYDVERGAGEPYISAENINDFQRLCGLYDGARGTLIGQKTLQALIIASRAGKNWKKAVAGMYDGKASHDHNKIHGIIGKLSGLKISHDGFLLSGNLVREEIIKLLKDAYAILGFKVEGERANLVYANYKFQVLSGVNNSRTLAPNYGLSTHKALIKALKASEKGDWKAAFK